MADTVLSFVAEGVLSKAFSLAAQEVSLARGFKADLEKFTERLGVVQTLLSDAEEKKVSWPVVNQWLNKLKMVAYDADAALDELEYEILRRRVETKGQMKNKVRDFFSPSRNSLFFRLKMAHKFKDVNSSLGETYKIASQIGLNAVAVISNNNEIREIRQTPPGVSAVAKVIGRDVDVSIIVDELVSSKAVKDLSVIAIVGMPGQGKTTLAQLVYENDKVKKHFEKKVWICVSYNFEVIRLLGEMIESLTSKNPQMSNMEGIIKELKKHLEGKVYLLVLDDVWNEIPEKCEDMLHALLLIGGSSESKIIVTTRSEFVVSAFQTPLLFRLHGLSDDDSWRLFRQTAFAEGGAIENPNLVAIGRKMVERCAGVPLAIKVLGGLMYHGKNELDWLSVQNSQIWNSPGEIGEVMPTLMLSYSHLSSSSLKQCFSLCAMFPKSSFINKDVLIQIWMALGLLHPPSGSRLLMENVGDSHFSTLIWNSLLQVVAGDEYGNIIICRMHDLVHDLAVYTAKNFCRAREPIEVSDMNDVVHLALPYTGGKMPLIPKGNLQRLQSLSISCDLLDSMSSNLKYLRVLELFGEYIGEVPKSIGKLKHLRYLDISDSSITKLSSSITKLYNLQTLRVQDLEEIPKNFSNLVNLRHFCVGVLGQSRNLLFVGIGELTSLQTIPSFHVSQKMGCLIGELGALDNLKGELNIFNLQDVRSMEDSRAANLLRKSNVNALRLAWGSRIPLEEFYIESPYLGGNNEEAHDEENGDSVAVLEGLEPHMNLKCLQIVNFKGNAFASWLMKVSRSASVLINLEKIVLKGCNRCERIPTLAHLPSLRDIEISGMSSVKFIGAEFYNNKDADGGGTSSTTILFPVLRSLVLKDLPNLEEFAEAAVVVSPPSSAVKVFPWLEVLTIENCPLLRTAPGHFSSSSLKTIRILGINDAVALKQMGSKLMSVEFLEIKDVGGGPVLQSVMEEVLGNNASSLRILKVTSCQQLSSLPSNLHKLVALESLRVKSCNDITSIPDEVVCGDLTGSLKVLDIIRLPNLTRLPKGLKTFMSLAALSLRHCDLLAEIPDICFLASLRKLYIRWCSSLVAIPSLEGCTSLEELWIADCPLVVSVSDLRSLTNLRRLSMGPYSEELDCYPWPYNYYSSSTSPSCSSTDVVAGSSLRLLTLHGWGKLKPSLPEKLQLLSDLIELRLYEFPEMESLPEWLGKLSSLRILLLRNCGKLRNLPTAEVMQRLTNLTELGILSCPLLKEPCRKGTGPEWFKIARIPLITINGEPIQNL